ncbi:hypothetical protein ACEPAI_3131 [Sanghuangporus weigelae]
MSSGGLVVTGWCLGNLFTIASIAYLNTYPSEVIQTLEPYLKSLIIYAPSFLFLGYPSPPGTYNPFNVSENPKQIAPISFRAWATSYYKHPAYSSLQRSDYLTPEYLIQHIPEQSYRPSTIESIPADGLAALIDTVPNERSEGFFFGISSSLVHEMLEKALLGADKSVLPQLNIYHVYGQEDVWHVPWAACEFEKDLEKWRTNGEHVRPIKVISVPGANHMIHWDDAETFLELITKGEIPQNIL